VRIIKFNFPVPRAKLNSGGVSLPCGNQNSTYLSGIAHIISRLYTESNQSSSKRTLGFLPLLITRRFCTTHRLTVPVSTFIFYSIINLSSFFIKETLPPPQCSYPNPEIIQHIRHYFFTNLTPGPDKIGWVLPLFKPERILRTQNPQNTPPRRNSSEYEL